MYCKNNNNEGGFFVAGEILSEFHPKETTINLNHIPEKQDFTQSIGLSAAVTPVTTISREKSKEKQKLVGAAVG